jgi:hypothetical protein
MDDLRREVQAALEKRYASDPLDAARRRDVVQAVATHRGTEFKLQWLAVVAAVVLAVAVVSGLMSTRLLQRATVSASPKASIADYGPPPAGVPLLYVHDPNHASWLIGYDWSGKARGTVKPPQYLANASVIGMSPDGQEFVAAEPNGSRFLLDRLGNPLPGAPAGFWADDNQHQCVVAVNLTTYVWTLYTQQAGTSLQAVGDITHDENASQTKIDVAACSFRSDKAILVGMKGTSVADVWVMRLSDGTVLAHHTYPELLLSNVVASADAAYIAENTFGTVGQGAVQGQGTSAIRRVSDWVQVGTVGSSAVRAFSGDDSLVLVTPSQVPELATLVNVVDWKTGTELWQHQAPYGVQGIVAEPSGGDFALALGTGQAMPTCAFCSPSADIVIAHRDGSTTTLPGRLTPLW